jgi:hemoglobin
MQREFLGAALDGPVRYSGRSLAVVHAGLGIRVRHFARFVQHLLETLRGLDLDEDDVVEIIARVDTYVDQITGESSIGA